MINGKGKQNEREESTKKLKVEEYSSSHNPK